MSRHLSDANATNVTILLWFDASSSTAVPLANVETNVIVKIFFYQVDRRLRQPRAKQLLNRLNKQERSCINFITCFLLFFSFLNVFFFNEKGLLFIQQF